MAPMPSSEPNFVMVAPDPATENVERLRRRALRLLTETPGGDPPEPQLSRESVRHDSETPPSAAPSMIAGVLAMPAVFLAIVFVALALFGKPGEEAPALAAAPQSPPRAQIAPAGGPAAAPASADSRGVITVPDDARIESIALDGDRVALHIEGPAGREIVVYDMREGRRVAAAAIETFSTEATDTLSMLTGPPPAAPAVPAAVEPAPQPQLQPQAPAYKVEPRIKPRSAP